MDTESVLQRYAEIRERIAGRAKLVAVSKGQPAEMMLPVAEQLLAHGEQALFGESYLQEYRKKRPMLPLHKAHFIGRLQRNKAKDVVALFDVIESISSLDLAAEVDAAAARAGKKQEVFLQVNISGDPAKAGFLADAFPELIPHEFPKFKNLDLAGLMTITRYYENPDDVRPDYRAMTELWRRVKADPACRRIIAPEFQLSMGMSSDFEIAVQEGATLVRVGTAIFGERE